MEGKRNLKGMEICDAIKKGTAFVEEGYKGYWDRILCGEKTCLEGYEDRLAEPRCIDGKERFICPLEKWLVEREKPQTGLEYPFGKI